jgi:hypothetical protein
MARKWTPVEDAALAENMAEHPPSWEGWRELLPGRSFNAIKARMGEARRREAHARPWTDAQRRSLLEHAVAMSRESGHAIGECVDELARLRREHARAG